MKKAVTFGPWTDQEKVDSRDAEPKRRSTAGRVSEHGEPSSGRRSTGAFADPKVHRRSSMGAGQSEGVPFMHHDPLMRRMSATARSAPRVDDAS